MATVITHAVIHGFDKEQHSAEVRSVTKKAQTLDVTNEVVQKLVDGIANLLGRRQNHQTWGRFDEADRAGPFRNSLRVQSQDSGNDQVFIQMTHVAMDEVVAKAQAKPASTGSHILFSQFREDEGPVRLLIAMIKQKGGIQLDENFVPVGIVEVDMSKLAHAADIRVQGFIDSLEVGDANDEEHSNYLSFLSQTVSDEAASYFVDALGCIVGVSARKATSGILIAVDAFLSANVELQNLKRQSRESLCEYMADRNAQGIPASLADITHLIRGLVAPQHAHLADGLEDFLNGERYQIPSEFFVHAGELKKHTKVKLETDDMQLKFNRGMVGTDENSKIIYNREARSLTITDLPTKIITQLDKEIQA